jgi:hypothetical protein
MSTTNTISYQYPDANAAFQRIHRQGQWTVLWKKLTGENPYLDEFNNNAFRLDGGPKYLGVKTIPVMAVTGSVVQNRNFDRHFRPLKKALREHWIGAIQRTSEMNRFPITVYKVGRKYFVKDGHHLVSAANYQSMPYIQAEVWEYQLRKSFAEPCLPGSQSVCDRKAVPAGASAD